MSEFKIELKGAEELIQKLESLNAYRLDAVLRKNATQIFNRGNIMLLQPQEEFRLIARNCAIR